MRGSARRTSRVSKTITKRGRPVNSGWRKLPYLDKNTMDHIMQNVSSTLPQLYVNQTDFFNEYGKTNFAVSTSSQKKIFRNQDRAPVPYSVLVGIALLNVRKPVPASVIYKFIEAFFPGCIPRKNSWKNCVRQRLSKEPFVSKCASPAGYCHLYIINPQRINLFENLLHRFLSRGLPVENFGLKNIEDWNALQTGTKDLSTFITEIGSNDNVFEANSLQKNKPRISKRNNKNPISIGVQTEEDRRKESSTEIAYSSVAVQTSPMANTTQLSPPRILPDCQRIVFNLEVTRETDAQGHLASPERTFISL